MLHRLILSFALFLTFAVAVPAPAATPTRPPKSAVTVNAVAVDAPDVDTNGSGCRQGTVGVAFNSDNSIMTIILDDFQAAIGPQAGSYKKRAFCRVNATITSPGWAFDVSSVDFRGYVNLDGGVNASLVSRWKWIDTSKGVDLKGKGNINKKLAGPYSDDFLLHKDGESSTGEQSACQKASAMFQISISASLSASSSTVAGFVKGDSVDSTFGEILNLGWRKC
ncbi:hypothetical protein EJ04DRAFT_589382 [Polyplosphaeria fusca]|uniref:Secreted protein n=1 Tax=Polyplosphaeria fusca TaxID=682080 RepID=A0A9P4UUT8_9PLEO|nr:hypothetical protein EJ04DRAFT_589382 [Polyplosphaeria fusca]